MKNFLVLLLATAAVMAGTHPAAAQTPVVLPFNPDYSYQDVRVEFGLFKSIREDDVDTRFFQAAFSRMFWNKLAWKAGFLYKGAGAEYKSDGGRSAGPFVPDGQPHFQRGAGVLGPARGVRFGSKDYRRQP